MNQMDIWMLIATLVMALGTAVMALLMWVDRNKRADVHLSPQPLAIKIIEEIHERFAAKKEFQDHVKENSARHAQIFNRIETTGINARVEIERHVEEINMDRRRTLEKLNDQFASIREDMASIKTELRLRNKP